MSKKYWKNRYITLRNHQAKIWGLLLKVAPHIYTKSFLNKIIVKDNFYAECFNDMEEATKEAANRFHKSLGIDKKLKGAKQ